MARSDLVTLGESFEDLVFLDLARLPRPGQEEKTSRFLRTVGGGAVITAVAAARLGTRSRVVSGLSDHAVATLRREGVAVPNLRRRGEPHAITAALSTRRDRSFATFNGVNDKLEGRLARAVAGERARHLHFAFHPHNCRRWTRLVTAARRRGATTSWDFGWNPGLLDDAGFETLLASLDWVFVNEQEAPLYARRKNLREAIAAWRGLARNAVIKLGPRGSRLVSPTLDERAPAPKVDVVDTTGAGDAFDGGFLDALLRGVPPAGCLRAGNRVGALSTRGAGGLARLPRARRRRA